LTRLAENADPVTLVRLEPIAVPPSALHDYAGRFACSELRRDLRVSEEDGGLTLGSWGRARGATLLDPIARDVFGGSGGGLPSPVKLEYVRGRGKTARVQGFTLTTDDMKFACYRRPD
jgi:hypothetical protein